MAFNGTKGRTKAFPCEMVRWLGEGYPCIFKKKHQIDLALAFITHYISYGVGLGQGLFFRTSRILFQTSFPACIHLFLMISGHGGVFVE